MGRRSRKKEQSIKSQKENSSLPQRSIEKSSATRLLSFLRSLCEVSIVILGLVKIVGDRGYQEKLNEIIVDSTIANTLAIDSIQRLSSNISQGKIQKEIIEPEVQLIQNNLSANTKRLQKYIGDGAFECFWEEVDIPDQSGRIVGHGKNVTFSVQSVDELGALKNYQMRDNPPYKPTGERCSFNITLPGFGSAMQVYVKLQAAIEWVLGSLAVILLILSWITINPRK